MRFTLREAMETADRAILFYNPKKGWAATREEGAEFDQLTWQFMPEEALRPLLDGLGDGDVIMPDELEQLLISKALSMGNEEPCLVFQWAGDEWTQPWPEAEELI